MNEQHSLTEYKIPGGLEEHAIGQFIETSLDDLRSLAESCHIQTDAIYLKNEISDTILIRRNHGFYALTHDMRTPENVVLLYSHDRASFTPPPPRNDDTADHFPGHYVDTTHSGRIQVVEARDNRLDNETWVSTAHANHDELETLNLKNFGVLWHTEHNHYASGSIVYNLKPVKVKNKQTKEIEDRTQIRVITTAGKSTPFFAFDDKFLGRIWGRLMARGGIQVNVDPDKATNLMMDDFLPRANAVLRGIDPHDLSAQSLPDELRSPLTPPVKPSKLLQFIPFAKSFAGKALSRGVQKSTAYFHNASTGGGLIKDIAVTAAKAAGLMVFHLVTKGPIVATVKLGVFMGSNTFKGLTNIFKEPELKSPFDSDINIASEYGEEGYLRNKGPGYYARLADDHTPFLRYLSYEETNARPADGTELRDKIRKDLAAQNLLDPFGAPVGSIFERRAIGDAHVLRVMQPDGIEIYILPEHSTAYARYRPHLENRQAEAMPDDLRSLLWETKHALCIYFDRAANNGKGEYSVDDISIYDFESKIIAHAQTKPTDIKTPDFIQSPTLQNMAIKARSYEDGALSKLRREFVLKTEKFVPRFLTNKWREEFVTPYQDAQQSKEHLEMLAGNIKNNAHDKLAR